MSNKELLQINALVGQMQVLLTQLTAQLSSPVEQNTAATAPDDEPAELLTIAECCQEVKGLTYFTVRQAVLRGDLPAVRTGRGEHGKVLISRAALRKYVNG